MSLFWADIKCDSVSLLKFPPFHEAQFISLYFFLDFVVLQFISVKKSLTVTTEECCDPY